MSTVNPAAGRVAALEQEAIQLAQALVRAHTVNRHSGDSTPGNEGNGQRLLAPLFQELGYRVEQFDCPPDIYRRMGVIGPHDRDFSDRPNLVAEHSFGAGGPTIILQAHMDTVGIEGMTLDDPLSGEVRDGKLWGRGSSDMKGGMAAGLTALRALHEFREQLHGRIVFASVVEEESNGSGAGALAFLDRARRGELFAGTLRPVTDTEGVVHLGEAAVCLDGSGPAVLRGYGGVLTVAVEVEGRAGHAAGPYGVSAIDKALLVKRGIDRFKAEEAQRGPGRVVNLGVFRSGTHPSLIPGSAVMLLNMTYAYQDAAAAEAAARGFGNAPGRDRFTELIAEASGDDPWLREHPPKVDWIKDLIPFQLPAEHPLVKQMAATHRAVLDEEALVETNPAWSDACYLLRFGGTPIVCYGAGTEGQAHGPAEYTDIWRIVACARVVAAFLYDRLRA
jgi:acetylornithine deacetylase